MRSPFSHSDTTVRRGSKFLTAFEIFWVLLLLSTLEVGARSGELYAYAAKPAEAAVFASTQVVEYFKAQEAEQLAREEAQAQRIQLQREKEALWATSSATTKTTIEINNNSGTTTTTQQKKQQQQQQPTIIYVTPVPVPAAGSTGKSMEELRAESDARAAAWAAESAARSKAFKKESDAKMKAFDEKAAQGLEDFRRENDPNYGK